MENPVRKTTFEVVKKAKEVRINKERIKKLAGKWKKEKKSFFWSKSKHLWVKDQKKLLTYLLILDSLNFCFWNKKRTWTISYKGKKYNGYFALSLSLKKFFKENPEKGNLKYFSKISFEEFKKILQGGKNLLFLEKRWQIVRAVSSVLVKENKDFEDLVKSASNKTSILVHKIQKKLPYFNDFAFYQNKKVFFLKRAQILVADIFGAFGGRGIGHFKDLHYLTAFADYKIPQILHHFGILEYSSSLEKKIKNRILIPAGSREEVEIRACSIWAIEYLREYLKNFYSFQIDWFLWNKSKTMKLKNSYHLTKTIFY